MVLGFCLGFFQNFLTTVAILLEAGAFVNMKQSSGETALMKVSSVFVLTWFNSKFGKLVKHQSVFVELVKGTCTVFEIQILPLVTLGSVLIHYFNVLLYLNNKCRCCAKCSSSSHSMQMWS